MTIGNSRNHRNGLKVAGLTLLALAVGLAGCDRPGGAIPTASGELAVTTRALSSAAAGVRYDLSCTDGTVRAAYVPLETEGLPGHVSAELAGERFADWFTVLSPGTCTVSATAMANPETPIDGCVAATAKVVIEAGKTTEVVLTIVCQTESSGALDVAAVIVDGQVIVDVQFGPSKFVLACEEATVAVKAEGGSGLLEYGFAVVSAPDGAVYTWRESGNVFTFAAETPGLYLVTVTVTDPSGYATTLTFPLHVSASSLCDDADPPFIYLNTQTELKRLNLETFALETVGAIAGDDLPWPTFPDIALNPTTGVIYGIQNDGVFALDPVTAAATLVCAPGLAGNALDVLPDGRLVVYGGYTVSTLDPVTCAATEHRADLSAASTGDIILADDGYLYGAGMGAVFPGDNVLIRIDPVTWDAVVVGAMAGAQAVYALSFHDGLLYAFSLESGGGVATGVYAVDPTSAATTLVHTIPHANAYADAFYGATGVVP